MTNEKSFKILQKLLNDRDIAFNVTMEDVQK